MAESRWSFKKLLIIIIKFLYSKFLKYTVFAIRQKYILFNNQILLE